MLNIDKKVEYIKIIADGGKSCYTSAKYQVGEDTLVISVDVDDKIYMRTPQKVLLCCITNDAIYKAETELLVLQYSNYRAEFITKIPEKFEKQQERKFFRVKIDKQVTIHYQDEGVQKTTVCRTDDLSAGGVRVILKEKLNIADNVKLDIVFDNKTLFLEAKTIKLFYGGNSPQVSFEFINLSEKDLDYISSVCFKKQLADISAKKRL